jgi:hypothetical protein
MLPKMTPKMTPTMMCVRRRLCVAAALLLLCATLAFGQGPASRLAVQVRPEMQLTPSAAGVQLAVRLAPSTSVQVWRAETCGTAPENAFVVTQSGRLQIPATSLGSGSKVCAASSDGTLTRSLDLAPRD